MESTLACALERAASGEALADADAIALADAHGADLGALIRSAAAQRDFRWGRRLTFSPKVFLPVTNHCRNRCDDCSFRRSPGWRSTAGSCRTPMQASSRATKWRTSRR